MRGPLFPLFTKKNKKLVFSLSPQKKKRKKKKKKGGRKKKKRKKKKKPTNELSRPRVTKRRGGGAGGEGGKFFEMKYFWEIELGGCVENENGKESVMRSIMEWCKNEKFCKETRLE